MSYAAAYRHRQHDEAERQGRIRHDHAADFGGFDCAVSRRRVRMIRAELLLRFALETLINDKIDCASGIHVGDAFREHVAAGLDLALHGELRR